MSQIAIGTIMLFASLAILMVLRFPIAYSLGISAVITATYMNIPYLNLFQKMTTGLSSFTFIAVPFFIMMAQVMCDGQITKKLMRMCNIFVGQIRGGTAIVNILETTLTQAGYIKRTPVSEYAAQSKGGMGKKGITTREEDVVVDVFTASTHDYILFFTDTGKVYRKKGYQIPQAGKTAKGTNIVNILQVEQGERVQTMVHTRNIEDEENRFLVMVTRNGTVKRLPVGTLKNLRNNGIRALRMEEGDQLISVRETDGTRKILIATHDGQAICFDENDVRPMGRDAVGVRGIRLREGDYVVGAARAGKTVLSITEKGYGKRTPVEEYRITGRGGLGIRNYAVTEKTGGVVGIKVVDGSEDLLLVTRNGILIRTPVDNIRVAGRSTQGVIVMRFKEEGDQVISMALTDHEESEDPAEMVPEE